MKWIAVTHLLKSSEKRLFTYKDVEMEGWTYLTDFLTEDAMRLVQTREAGKPFLLYMSYTTPHTPLDPRPDLLKKYAGIANKSRRNYAAMVASLDEEVGQGELVK